MPHEKSPRLRPQWRKGREAKDRPPRGLLLRRLQRRAGRRLDAGRRGWRGVYVPRPGAWAQQVVVKAQVVRHGMSGHRSWKAALRQHLDYLQREGGALGGEPGQLYTGSAYAWNEYAVHDIFVHMQSL